MNTIDLAGHGPVIPVIVIHRVEDAVPMAEALLAGGVTVLELKTGKPVPEHEQQLEMYLTAARAMFPGTPVEGKLIYARQANLDDRSFDAQR